MSLKKEMKSEDLVCLMACPDADLPYYPLTEAEG